MGIDPSGKGLILEFLYTTNLRLMYLGSNFMLTYGVYAEAVAFINVLTFLNATMILSTGVDPETGENADILTLGMAIIDILPAGKFISKPLKGPAKKSIRKYARKIWDIYSKYSRSGGQIHHRLPLEWAHLFPNLNPNRLTNLVWYDNATHKLVNNIWREFKRSLNGKTPTKKQVMEIVLKVEKQFYKNAKYIETKHLK